MGLLWFPFSRNEPQPYKKRPCLILAMTGVVPDQAILVAMITGNPSRAQTPGPADVVIQNWQGAGLLKASTVRSRRLWTAEDRDIIRILGSVDQPVLEDTMKHVRALVGA
ncbi:type II toxin-antitoxin system PemK/MazF family toxin [Planomonospora parontospora]|uniref:type II toxin-antitoxin system PemK/MazF family toxin n=1 Tax=Planomonospora parontospora TaxID=58119 RepID=UPI001671637C|nr:type II toxin-antitoxin system PemK/MazF family toxin [Planomonospora parontospora]